MTEISGIEIILYPYFLENLSKMQKDSFIDKFYKNHRAYCAQCGSEFTKEALQFLCFLNRSSASSTIISNSSKQGNNWRAGKCPLCGHTKMKIIYEDEEEQKPYDEWYSKGKMLYQESSFTLSKNAFEKVLTINKTNSEVWKDLALTLIKLDSIEEAQGAIENSLAINPSNTEAKQILEECRNLIIKNGKKSDIKPISRLLDEKFLVNNDDFVKYHEKMDKIEHGFDKESIEIANSFFQKGLQAYENNNMIEAESDYLNAIKHYPHAYEAYVNLGLVYEKIGKTELALETYQKAINLGPFDFDSFGRKGLLLLQIGKYQDAQYYLRKAISLYPHNPEYLTNYACAHICLDNYEEAQSALERALKINPDLEEAKQNRDELIKSGHWKYA